MNAIDYKEQTLMQCALGALHRTTGHTGQVVAREPKTADGLRPDARVEIEANGQRYTYAAEIKRVDRFAPLAEFKNRIAQNAEPLLLVAPRVTPEMADKCRELDLQFIDTAGNAYLHGPGMFVLVKGQRPTEGDDFPPEKRTGTPTNLRVIYALLCKPELLNAPYRDINAAAGVALGAVGWVFNELKDRGYITGEKGNRVLLDRQRLMQEWVINYPIKLRTKLHPRRFRAPTADWWKKADITKHGAQWGAEVAAEKLTGYLKPQTCTIYIQKEHAHKNLTKLITENRLRADAQGDIEILETFWEIDGAKPLTETVHPLLIYADLAATLDPRNLETAKLIHERYLTATQAEG